MRRILWQLALLVATVAIDGCSKNGGNALELLKSDAAFSSPIAVLLPATDDSQLYQNILNGTQAVGGLMVIMGCKGNLFQSARIQNFYGALDVASLVYDNWATVRSIKIPNENFDCTIYNPELQSTAQDLSSELGGQPDDNQQNVVYLPIAKRTDLQITYQNEYETDIPGGGRTKVIAITCSYRIEPSSKIKGLSNPGTGQCQGKWAFDNDTGKWVKAGLSLSDPNVAVAPPQIASDVRTLAVATTSPNGDRLLLEGQIVQCEPFKIEKQNCTFSDKAAIAAGGPAGILCTDPGPYKTTGYSGKQVVAPDDRTTPRTGIVLTNSGQQAITVGYWVAGETCSMAPPSLDSAQSQQPSGCTRADTCTTYLGVNFGAPDSLQITHVEPGSPAEVAGLHAGDAITKVQGFRIADRNDLDAVVHGFKPGDRVHIAVDRSGQPQEFDVTLASHSPSPLANMIGIGAH